MKLKPNKAQFSKRSLLLATCLIVTTLATPGLAQEQGSSPQIENLSAEPGFNMNAAFTQRDSLIAIISPAAGDSVVALPVKLVARLAGGVNPGGFRARLNGKDITALFRRSVTCGISVCDLSATVQPVDGLLKGSNELSVEFRSDGLVSGRDAKVFTVAVNPPTANAGSDQRAKNGRLVVLDGTTSSHGNAGNSLAHAWGLIHRPPGSRAELDDPNSPRPAFTPDKNGIYIAQLIVSKDQGFTSDPDTATITVTANEPNFIEVQTHFFDGNGYGILVLPNNYSSLVPESQTGLHVVVLDRAAVRTYGLPKAFTGSTLVNDLTGFLNQNAADNTKLVIFSTYSGLGVDPSSLAPLLEQFGATTEFRNLHDPALPFSLIGVRGLRPGQAYQAWGKGTPGANLSGRLTLDSQNNYAFTQFDYYINFELTPSPNLSKGGPRIAIGTQTYAPQIPAGSAGGFLMVVVDRAAPTSSPVNSSLVYSTNGGASGIDALISDLKNNTTEDKLIFITSYGLPFPDQPDITYQIGQLIQEAGGTNEIIQSIDYTNPGDTYSLVGSAGPDAALSLPPFTASESSTILPGAPSGAIRGVLGLGRRNNWYRPIASDLTQVVNLDFYRILAQPWQGFPVLTGNQLNALEWISAQLCGCNNIRESYEDTNIDINTRAIRLSVMKPPSNPAPSFDAADFSAVQGQLLTEMKYVADIRRLNRNLTQLWNAQQSNIGLLLGNAGAKVKASLPPLPGEGVVPSIIEDLSEFLLAAIAAIPTGESAFAPMLGALSAGFDFGVNLANTLDGNGTADISTTVANIEAQAADHFARQLTAQGTMFDMIYEDWGRMQALGKALDNPDDRNWSWNGDVTTGQILNILSTSMERSFYRSLMPTAYAIAKIENYPDPTPNGYSAADQQVFRSYSNNTYTGVRLPNGKNEFLILTRWPWNDQPDIGPPSDNLFNYLYGPRPGGLSVYKANLFRHWPFKISNCNNSNADGRGGSGCPSPR